MAESPTKRRYTVDDPEIKRELTERSIQDEYDAGQILKHLPTRPMPWEYGMPSGKPSQMQPIPVAPYQPKSPMPIPMAPIPPRRLRNDALPEDPTARDEGPTPIQRGMRDLDATQMNLRGFYPERWPNLRTLPSPAEYGAVPPPPSRPAMPSQ